jgi:hypothetical protein
MQNKIDLIKGAKTIIVSDISGVDFDLRKGDVVVFDEFDIRFDGENSDEWKENFIDEVEDVSKLKGAMLILESENCTGWFPIDILTKTILSY